MKYRPEIDGLRAIAVTSVVFYHAGISLYGINPFQGGFLGVDIFFVISGYLITLILLEQAQNKDISWKQFYLRFYERRARRILPALFCVMFISIPKEMFFYADPNHLSVDGNQLVIDKILKSVEK